MEARLRCYSVYPFTFTKQTDLFKETHSDLLFPKITEHRLFLTPYDITPTYKNVANRFSVKYYLNLVLVDEEDRRYFKQQEITMFRHEL